MDDSSLNTTLLNDWLQRWRAGDLLARDQLIQRVCRRLERLARKMLRGFPSVGRWEETDDVLQNSLLRLIRSLEQIKPTSVREFYGLASLQIRRELLDLGRSHRTRPEYLLEEPHTAHDRYRRLDRAEATDVSDLERWTAFHEAVEMLVGEEREVISLVFYHGKTQNEVAEIFRVHERTVRRWWQSACLKIARSVRTDLPDPAN